MCIDPQRYFMLFAYFFFLNQCFGKIINLKPENMFSTSTEQAHAAVPDVWCMWVIGSSCCTLVPVFTLKYRKLLLGPQHVSCLCLKWKRQSGPSEAKAVERGHRWGWVVRSHQNSWCIVFTGSLWFHSIFPVNSSMWWEDAASIRLGLGGNCLTDAEIITSTSDFTADFNSTRWSCHLVVDFCHWDKAGSEMTSHAKVICQC